MDNPSASVLIVEDDQSLRESLAMVLEHKGYDVAQAGTGEDGLRLAESDGPHVIVLDVNLPGLDGFEVCSLLRRRHYLGQILMLTARSEVNDKVTGLDAGADDYLAKPFALEELLARVRSLARRVVGATAQAAVDDALRIDDLVIHRAARQVERGGVSIELTRTEFDLLELLVMNTDLVMTHEVIHETIWGYDAEYGSNSLQVFVSALRRKVDVDGRTPLISTVRGVGYVIRTPQ